MATTPGSIAILDLPLRDSLQIDLINSRGIDGLISGSTTEVRTLHIALSRAHVVKRRSLTVPCAGDLVIGPRGTQKTLLSDSLDAQVTQLLMLPMPMKKVARLLQVMGGRDPAQHFGIESAKCAIMSFQRCQDHVEPCVRLIQTFTVPRVQAPVIICTLMSKGLSLRHQNFQYAVRSADVTRVPCITISSSYLREYSLYHATPSPPPLPPDVCRLLICQDLMRIRHANTLACHMISPYTYFSPPGIIPS